MDWEKRKKLLFENNFILSDGRWTHRSSNKVFWTLELKELNDCDFMKVIKCRYIYEIN